MLPAGTIACARCGTQLPSIATLCDGCGARVAVPSDAQGPATPIAAPVSTTRPGFVAASRGMVICHGCGAIAPQRRSVCEVCRAPIGTSLEAIPPRDDGAYWVQIRSELVCRQCGQRSPLDPLDCDGSVTCGRCGAIQAFDPEAWRDALAHAHAVGDLGGPDLLGKNAGLGWNPHAELGVTRAAAEHVTSGMVVAQGVIKTRNVAIAAAPGHPLCARCGCPLHVEARGNEAFTQCRGCGERGHYRFPIEALAMAPGLVAAIGDELRVDRPSAQLDATSAGMVVAVKCPSCGGSLHPEPGKPFAVCSYCGTHCRIPQRTMLALHQGATEPAPWWALFRGPSALRQRILSGDHGEHDRPREKEATVQPIEQPPIARSPRDEVIAWTLQITIPLLLLAVMGLALHTPLLVKWVQGFVPHEVAPNAAPR